MTFDIKAFEDFCRSKPADETYDFWSLKDCAVLQFVAEEVGEDSIDEIYHYLHFNTADALHKRPWTFSALADRLAKLRDGQSA